MPVRALAEVRVGQQEATRVKSEATASTATLTKSRKKKKAPGWRFKLERK